AFDDCTICIEIDPNNAKALIRRSQAALELKKSKRKNTAEDAKVILQHWIRMLQIKFGWIRDFDRIVINYVYAAFIFDMFCASSKLINTFTGHTSCVNSIDYSKFDDCQFICSGSDDTTICVWDVDNNKKIQSFNGHSRPVYCVKFSSYHYHNNRQN
ncbi:WD repeat protein, partial [Reticulomyxa filosa]